MDGLLQCECVLTRMTVEMCKVGKVCVACRLRMRTSKNVATQFAEQIKLPVLILLLGQLST